MYFLTVPEVQQKLTTLKVNLYELAGKVTEDPINLGLTQFVTGFVMGDGQARIPAL
jgi:hypothetical protein